jgi:hypothetical protein
MGDVTEITNLTGDLDCYADELDGEGWHNAANGCRAAASEIARLTAERDALRERVEILEAEIRVMRKIPGEVDRVIHEQRTPVDERGHLKTPNGTIG